MIDNCGLIELCNFGGSMSKRNRKWAKLDWALVNKIFLQHFNLASVEYRARKSSDHKPMILRNVP